MNLHWMRRPSFLKSKEELQIELRRLDGIIASLEPAFIETGNKADSYPRNEWFAEQDELATLSLYFHEKKRNQIRSYLGLQRLPMLSRGQRNSTESASTDSSVLGATN